MKDLTITLLQYPLEWQDIAGNIDAFQQRLLHLDQKTDLVILPEMFTTGFTMKAAEFAEFMDGFAVNWISGAARQFGFHMCGSVIIEENGAYYNRLLWAQPDGQLKTYDKRHLFRMAKEHTVYSAGKQRLIVEIDGWKICPLVCYDLRFPVWSRNRDQEYDLLIYVANWPEKRAFPWKTLLPARAIENQAYVAAVNRVGKDGHGYPYSGDSCVIAPDGETLASYSHASGTFTHTLSRDRIETFRERFPAWRDADQFTIQD